MKSRRWIALLICAHALGSCTTSPHDSPHAALDADTADAGAVEELVAQDVALDPKVTGLAAKNVLEALEAVAASIPVLDALALDVSGLAGDIDELAARVALLEDAPPPEGVASSIAFDDSTANSGALDLQNLGEAPWTRLMAVETEIGSRRSAVALRTKRLGDLEQAVSELGSSEGVALSPTSSELFDSSGLDDALSQLDARLGKLEEFAGLLGWDDNCPPDMKLVDNGVCVGKKRFTDSWQSAAVVCRFARGRLCTASEFVRYCEAIATIEPEAKGGAGGLDSPEWIEGVVPGAEAQVMAMWGATCDQVVTRPLSDTGFEYVRCCSDPVYSQPVAGGP